MKFSRNFLFYRFTRNTRFYACEFLGVLCSVTVLVTVCKARFKRRILHAPNAIQTIDN